MKPSEAWITEEYYTGEDAETANEIAEKKKDIDPSAVRRYAKKMVAMGIWKEVMVKRESKRNPEKAWIANEKTQTP